MQCRFFDAGCTATGSTYAPSAFEIAEYCANARYRVCPFYCMTASDGKFALAGLRLEALPGRDRQKCNEGRICPVRLP